MSKNTFRVVTRGSDGSLRIKDYPKQESLLRMHTQIGVDDCSTDLDLRGMPVFRGLVGPMPDYFEPDEKTQKPNGTIEYEVVKSGSNERIFDFVEELAQVPGAAATQVTVEKVLPLKNLDPGQYKLKIKVTDKNRNQTLAPEAVFTIS